MSSSEQRFRQLVAEYLEVADLLPRIDAAALKASRLGRNQLQFSLSEAGLLYGVNILLDHGNVVSQDFPAGLNDQTFDPYSVGTECIKAKLTEIVRESRHRDAFDFILTTHDGLHFYDLKTETDFQGDILD